MNKNLILMISMSFLLVMPILGVDSYTNVSAPEAKVMIDSKPSLVVLDVRSQSEYNSGHIRNAKLIPHNELEGRLDELNETDEILVYCLTDIRSSNASQILIDNGFLHVYTMLGGITAWKNEGYVVYLKYPSLQETIANANAGDVIYVASGLYQEHLNINKSLTLVGENKDTTILDGTYSGTVIHVETSNVSINSFTIRNSGCMIEGWSGIYVENDSHNFKVANSHIIQNCYGIRLNQSYNSSIAYNNIELNNYGIQLYNSSTNEISANTIMNNNVGVWLNYSSNNNISANDINTNDYGGLWLSFSSHNNLRKNNIREDDVGITLVASSSNRFYHNNFIDNTQHVYIQTSGETNFWNSSNEGNYWSNYAGIDSNFDGISDTPHILDVNNTDYYPLMGTFSSFNTSLGKYVNVISNSTIENFRFFDSNNTIKMQVSNVTLDQTYGFCRVSVPKNLLAPPYNIKINNGSIAALNFNDTIYDNGTHRWIYFAYEHSTLEIVILPEYFLTILPLFIIATLLVAFVFQKGAKSESTTEK